MGYAENLRRISVQKGIDQAALADRVGISRSTISRILAGLREPKLGLAARLAGALDVPLDALVAASDELVEGEEFVSLTEEERAILRIVRRLGCDEAMDRLLEVPPGRREEAG